jgi:hypothetical protein
MSETFALVERLVASGEVRISEHGYDELADDAINGPRYSPVSPPAG